MGVKKKSDVEKAKENIYMTKGALFGGLIGAMLFIISGQLALMGLIIFGAVFGMMGGLGYNGYKNSKKIIERDSLVTCPNCGSKLDISGDGNKKICNYCGSVF